MSSGPTPNFSLTILPISLCLSPGKLSELSLIQTPHLRFQDSLPTSACRDILNAHLQASCRSFHLSKTPHLRFQDSLPTSACRDILNAHLQASCRSFHLSKHLTCVSRTYSQLQPNDWLPETTRSGQSVNRPPASKWPYSQHVQNWNKDTLSESRILKFFDALDFTTAAYQPSDHFRTLVQAQHRSRENLGAQYKRSQLHLRWRP